MLTPQQSKVSKKDIESIYPLSPMQAGDAVSFFI
jgi:hypothetical protein